jgi:hypothetical protein
MLAVWLVLDVERPGSSYISAWLLSAASCVDSSEVQDAQWMVEGVQKRLPVKLDVEGVPYGVRVFLCCVGHARRAFSHTESFWGCSLRHMNSHCTRNICLAVS